MAIRPRGGEAAAYALQTPVKIADTFSAAAAVGDHVLWSTSSNLCVNSMANTNQTLLAGKIVNKADSTTATVQWFAWANMYEFTYSSVAPTLGMTAEAGAVHASTVRGSTNTTEAPYNRVVAVDHVTGKCLVVFR